jgi:ABC-type nitrate/sulfonate/bicarbonate transport system substrate-binding protein
MAMVTPKRLGWFAIIAIAVVALFLFTRKPNVMRVGIAPFPNLSMFVNALPQRLDRKYGTRIEFVTMPWTDILPTIAGAAARIDIGFASYIEYIAKYENSPDPVLFVFPAFAFKDGTFISFKEDVPKLDKSTIRAWQSTPVWQWLKHRMGAKRDSIFEMMLFYLATTYGDDFKNLDIVDTPIEEGLDAAERGRVDIAASGLTTLSEAEGRGARAVLTMDDLGFADITGFVVKKSVYERRRRDVENVIVAWFASAAYVLSNIDKNAQESLAYLNRNASTPMTLEQFKKAIGQEYFPLTRTEARMQLVNTSGRFSAWTIGRVANEYWIQKGRLKTPTPLPEFP